MCKIAVVYCSKYGSTKKYAQWIAEEVHGELKSADNVRVNELLSYDTIIYGGYLYATGIKGFQLIKKNYHLLKKKNLIVYGVGLTSINEKTINAVIAHNFTEEMKQNALLFLLRGSMDFSKLKWLDKRLMGMMYKMIQKKKPEDLTEDDKGFLSTYNKNVDFTDKEQIQPIVEAVKKYTSNDANEQKEIEQ